MVRKKALLFIFEGFAEFEISVAISMLRNTHDLITVALDKSAIKSEAGLTIVPDHTFTEIIFEDYELLIIPGGDLQPIVDKQELFDWVAAFIQHGRIVASICAGTYVLARANVLKEIPYTVTLTKEEREILGHFQEENFHYEPVLRHGNILTAQGHAYVDFGIELNKMVRDVSEGAIEFYRGKRNVMMEES